MSFNHWGYEFAGPFFIPDNLPEAEGIYVVFCKPAVGNFSVVDVGQAEDVKERLTNHDREDCWRRSCRGTLYYAVHQMLFSTEDERRAVEMHIRSQTNPPCGER